MNKSIEQVKEFHETFSHPIGDISKAEPLATRQLRIKLLFEELAELAEASDCQYTLYDLCSDAADDWDGGEKLSDGDTVNQIEELDALCDIQYVLNGKILTAGMHDIFDTNFERVHQNNMSKAHDSWYDASMTISKLQFGVPNHTHYDIKETNGKYLVVNSSGKIIKPWNHIKVSLTLK